MKESALGLGSLCLLLIKHVSPEAPPDVAASVCVWPVRAPGMGPVGLPWQGPGFGQGSGTEVPPCEGQAQLEAGAAAQGFGSLGAREGGGSCCMMEFIRRQ